MKTGTKCSPRSVPANQWLCRPRTGRAGVIACSSCLVCPGPQGPRRNSAQPRGRFRRAVLQSGTRWRCGKTGRGLISASLPRRHRGWQIRKNPAAPGASASNTASMHLTGSIRSDRIDHRGGEQQASRAVRFRAMPHARNTPCAAIRRCGHGPDRFVAKREPIIIPLPSRGATIARAHSSGGLVHSHRESCEDSAVRKVQVAIGFRASICGVPSKPTGSMHSARCGCAPRVSAVRRCSLPAGPAL